MTEVWLVRHGSTKLNEQNILHGSLDPPLSRLGIEQAFQLATRIHLGQAGYLDDPDSLLYPRHIDIIYSSPLLRARQTAEILRRNGEEIIIDPRLKERSVGEYEGLTPKAIKRNFPKGFLKELHLFDTQPPGGESIRQTQVRAATLIEEIRESYPDKSLVLVSHCITIQAIYYYLNPEVVDQKFYIYALQHCGFMRLTI